MRHIILMERQKIVMDDRATPECRALVRVIETLLSERRQYRHRHLLSYHPKRWTREELCDLAYTSYRSMLAGKIQAPPRPADIAAIADYLECSLDERNRLVRASGYETLQEDLHGAAYERALGVGQQLVTRTPLPALMVRRDWAIQAVNTPLLHLFGAAHANLVLQRTILHALFDPALLVRSKLEHIGAWDWFAQSSLMHFQAEQTLCIYEPWYDVVLAQLAPLPGFTKTWNFVRVFNNAKPSDTNVQTSWYHTITHFAGATYPQVWIYVPDTDE